MTNHTPIFTSSSATGSFTEFANTTDSTALHTLSGTMNFNDSDHSDTHTTTAALHSAVLSSGSVIPAASLADFNAAMSSQITSDSNGSGKLKWSFSDADDDFDFLAKNQTLVLTYDITVSDNHGGTAIQTVKVTVTGTDDKPVISMAAVATVTEQAESHALAHARYGACRAELHRSTISTNTGHTATVLSASATGATTGLLPGTLGTAELMSFFNVDNVVKDVRLQHRHHQHHVLGARPCLRLSGGRRAPRHHLCGAARRPRRRRRTQNVLVTVVGTNDKPIYLCGPESAHLIEGQNVSPAGNLTAHGDLFFTDVDLSDTHTVSTTVSAARSGGGAIPLTERRTARGVLHLAGDSTGHLLGEVDWNFALANSSTNFLAGGETLTLVYHVAVNDPSGGIGYRRTSP